MIENIEPKYFTDEFEDGITETSDILGNSDVVLSDLLNDERLIPIYTEKQMQEYAESVKKGLDIVIKALKEILEISESHDEDTVVSIIADTAYDALEDIGGDDE